MPARFKPFEIIDSNTRELLTRNSPSSARYLIYVNANETKGVPLFDSSRRNRSYYLRAEWVSLLAAFVKGSRVKRRRRRFSVPAPSSQNQGAGARAGSTGWKRERQRYQILASLERRLIRSRYTLPINVGINFHIFSRLI